MQEIQVHLMVMDLQELLQLFQQYHLQVVVAVVLILIMDFRVVLVVVEIVVIHLVLLEQEIHLLFLHLKVIQEELQVMAHQIMEWVVAVELALQEAEVILQQLETVVQEYLQV